MGIVAVMTFLFLAWHANETHSRGMLDSSLAASAAVGFSGDADGWRVEVDGVAIDTKAALELAAAPSGVEDLELARLALFADSIGRHCTREAVDWRLVAALIAEESGFDPNAMSAAGAFGLMQVKEAAAREVGVYPFEDPDSNVHAGVRYLAAMREAFPAPTRRDHDALMLAAYNMGPGHLHDAQRLAADFGYPAQRWDEGIASAVLLLEQPAIHRRTRHGFVRGASVVRYVDRVLARYAAYQRRFPSVNMPSVAMIADIANR